MSRGASFAYAYWIMAGGLVAFGCTRLHSIGLPLLLLGLALAGVGLSKPALRNGSVLGAAIGIALIAVLTLALKIG